MEQKPLSPEGKFESGPNSCRESKLEADERLMVSGETEKEKKERVFFGEHHCSLPPFPRTWTHQCGRCIQAVSKHCEAWARPAVLRRLLSLLLFSSPRTLPEHPAEPAAGRTWTEKPGFRRGVLPVQTSSSGLPRWFLAAKNLSVELVVSGGCEFLVTDTWSAN